MLFVNYISIKLAGGGSNKKRRLWFREENTEFIKSLNINGKKSIHNCKHVGCGRGNT